MQPFRRFAVFTLARDASLVALAACILMVALSFMPSVAFRTAGTIALLFSIALALRALFLTDESFTSSEVWQALKPEDRPVGQAAQDYAREDFRDLLLHFAKTAAAFAIGLYASALLTAMGSEGGQAVVTASLH